MTTWPPCTCADPDSSHVLTPASAQALSDWEASKRKRPNEVTAEAKDLVAFTLARQEGCPAHAPGRVRTAVIVEFVTSDINAYDKVIAKLVEAVGETTGRVIHTSGELLS
jgi:hypothetical protein